MERSRSSRQGALDPPAAQRQASLPSGSIMGASLSWIAVKGRLAEDILRELRLRPTGVTGLEGESPFVGAQSDGGWYLVVARGAEHAVLHSDVLERLSDSCDVLTCTVEEHVMFSQATGWRNGRRLWVVTHEGEQGPVGIAEEGVLPPEYPPIPVTRFIVLSGVV